MIKKRKNMKKMLKKVLITSLVMTTVLTTTVPVFAAGSSNVSTYVLPPDPGVAIEPVEIVTKINLKYLDSSGKYIEVKDVAHPVLWIDLYRKVYDANGKYIKREWVCDQNVAKDKRTSITTWFSGQLPHSEDGKYTYIYEIEAWYEGIDSNFYYTGEHENLPGDNIQNTGANVINLECKLSDVTGVPDADEPDTPDDPVVPDEPVDFGEDVSRVYGKTRYETSIATAEKLKETLGVDTFNTVIIATGDNYADALSGSYLACVKNAPILMASGRNTDALKTFVKANLANDGKIYILGGNMAVSEDVENAFSDYDVERLSGKTRYETNIEILKEAGVEGKDILVCTGVNFADSLSASASGNPILLVGNTLTEAQRNYLDSIDVDNMYIIGGEKAVGTVVANEVTKYDNDGTAERLSGATRYETSVKVADKFVNNPDSAVLAYAQNFPDGLCGGPLAYAMGAPLILTDSLKPNVAVEFTSPHNIKKGVVLGGNILVTDDVVKSVFCL